MENLFTLSNSNSHFNRPLSDQLRPKAWEDFLGVESWPQNQKRLLENIKKTGYLPNLILWGSPGTGKTTFARLIPTLVKNLIFIQVNAIDTGAKKIKEIGNEAKLQKQAFSKATVLFIDEIHRLNKAQQDVLLPYTEAGDLVLVGATTENPSYELNHALLSRCQILLFSGLNEIDSKKVLEKAAMHFNFKLEQVLTVESIEFLISRTRPDTRGLLTRFENICLQMSESQWTEPLSLINLQEIFLDKHLGYDKNSSLHYDLVSAFIKSLRGSDPDAALYYMARMIDGGEEPIFVARRMVILASEDIGNADPKALPLAVAGLQATEIIGLPEAAINLAQVATYLASAPKSNRSYLAWNSAKQTVIETGDLPVPLYLRSSQTNFSKKMGLGQGYLYSHDFPKAYSGQTYLPEAIKNKKFYEPSQIGFEKKILEFLNWVKSLNK